MQNIPAVSIVVAVYNAEPYLHRCMESILNQTLHNIEILLINDGSTDNSGQRCDDYAAKDSRVKVFHRTNHGLSATRQFGLEHATGTYVIHADPDDWLDLDMLEKMFEIAEKEKADMVICDYINEYPHSNQRVCQKPSSTDSNEVLIALFDSLHGSCCNKLIKTQTIHQYNISFPEKLNYGEDKVFNIQLLQHPINVAYCSSVAYHYDQYTNPSSFTRSITPEMTFQRVEYIKKMREYQHTSLITIGIYSAEFGAALMAIRTKAYSPPEFFSVFKQLASAPILRLPNIPFHMRLIVWTAFHINYRTADMLMAFKLWYRKRIKGINE